MNNGTVSPLDDRVCVCVCVLSRFSRVRLFATPWTVAHLAPRSMEFFRQEYWNGLPFPTAKDLPGPETETVFLAAPALARGVLYH